MVGSRGLKDLGACVRTWGPPLQGTVDPMFCSYSTHGCGEADEDKESDNKREWVLVQGLSVRLHLVIFILSVSHSSTHILLSNCCDPSTGVTTLNKKRLRPSSYETGT